METKGIKFLKEHQSKTKSQFEANAAMGKGKRNMA